MEKNKILQASLLDIVFDERNKVYGAYELRSKYTHRLSKALLATGAIALFILLASFVGSKLKPSTHSITLDIPELELQKIADDPTVDPPPPLVQKPIEQPRIEMTRFTAPRIVREEIEPDEAMKDVDELDRTKISTINVAGEKNNDIIAPPIEEKTGVITAPRQDENDKARIDVQIQAKFPGGDEAWRKYISREIERNTDELQQDGKAGTCLVQFIVDKNGKISDVEVLTMKGSKLAEICANAIRKGPDWAPAENNGIKVKAYRKQPVTFRIDNL